MGIMRQKLVYILLLLSLLLVLVSCQSSGPTITWSFEVFAFDPAENYVGVCSKGHSTYLWVGVNNTGDLTIKITRVGLNIDWLGEEFIYVENEVKLRPGESSNVGKISFSVPSDVTPGRHEIKFKIDVLEFVGDGWVEETYFTDPFLGLVVLSMPLELEVDFDFLDQSYSFHQGDKVDYWGTLENSGGTEVEVDWVKLYPGWDDEFFFASKEFKMSPGESKKIDSEFYIPKSMSPGKLTASLEVQGRFRVGEEEFTCTFTPDYVISYDVLKEESFVQKYKEALGIITATASAASVVLGFMKKWKGKDTQ